MCAPPVFSIIVPVYKVEPYLQKCVDSVLMQTFPDFELILVDDGSPDDCPMMCDMYAQADSRIVVIHKENGGLSSARNAGIQEATGQYIAFLDADDYWDNVDALSLICTEFGGSNADIVLLKHRKLDMASGRIAETTSTLSPADLCKLSYPEQLSLCITDQLYDTCAWNKVFRRTLMKNADLYFRDGIIAEDIDWCARLSLAATGLSVVETPVHIYRKGRPGSITSSLSLKNLVDTKGSIQRCLSYVNTTDFSDEFLSAYYGYVAYRYVIWMAESAVVNAPQKETLIREMKEYDWLLNYGQNPKVKIASYFRRIFGYTLCSKALGFYLKHK